MTMKKAEMNFQGGQKHLGAGHELQKARLPIRSDSLHTKINPADCAVSNEDLRLLYLKSGVYQTLIFHNRRSKDG